MRLGYGVRGRAGIHLRQRHSFASDGGIHGNGKNGVPFRGNGGRSNEVAEWPTKRHHLDELSISEWGCTSDKWSDTQLALLVDGYSGRKKFEAQIIAGEIGQMLAGAMGGKAKANKQNDAAFADAAEMYAQTGLKPYGKD